MSAVVGVPREIKDKEGRVSMQPDGVVEPVAEAHDLPHTSQKGVRG